MEGNARRPQRKTNRFLFAATSILSLGALFSFAVFTSSPYTTTVSHRMLTKGVGALSNESIPAVDSNQLRKTIHRGYANSLTSPLYSRPFPKVDADVPKQEAVKEAFLHAWKSYSNLCFGYDHIAPLSGTCSNSLGGGLMIIDSISTIILMNLTDEYQRVRQFVKESFAPNGSWSLFEFIIRYLGGLVSAAELTGDPVFKDAATKVGYALLPIMKDTGGFYNSRFSFHTSPQGDMSASGGRGAWNLAEVGTFQVEFLTLARMTGDPEFVKTAMNVYQTLWRGKGNTGLISAGVGAGEDSYYEYIIKSYLMTGGVSKPMLKKYMDVVRDIKNSMVFQTVHMNLTGIAPGGKTSSEPMMEHLATFAGGMLAVGSVVGNDKALEDLELADRLATTYATVYKTFKSGVMAEQVRYNAKRPQNPKDFWVSDDEYILRPESVESVYLMWKFTGLQKYRDFAWEMFKGINKSCRADKGFAEITGVDSERVRQRNSMESFFLAETLKYLYLTFSDSDLISPTEWVFNTEAHPVRIWDEDTIAKFRKLVTDLPLE